MYRISLCLFFTLTYCLSAQNIDGYLIDALRYSSDNKVYNARSAGLGFSYMGIINDLGAINYNPAGLTLSNNSEFSVGTYFNLNNTNSKYYGTNSNSDKNSFGISNIAISSPIYNYYNPQEKYFLGVSYSNSQSYDQITSANGFNPNRSYIGSEALKNRDWTNETGVSQDGTTLIDDSLNQNYRLDESGGYHELKFAIATELGEMFSIGGSLDISFGTYHYLRFLDESDIKNIYNEKSEVAPYGDLDKSYHTLQYDHSFSSIGLNVGFFYNPNDNMRFSFSFKTPYDMEIKETFYEEADVVYDNKDEASYNNVSTAVTTDYDVILPWSVSLGYSYNYDNLIVAGALRYKGYSSINYIETSDEYLLSLNSKISDVLQGNFRFGLGAEYSIPKTILQVRAGATFETSPVEGNSNIASILSCGISAFLFEPLRFDAFAQLYSNQKDLYLYDNQFISVKNKIYRVGAGLTYRF